MPQGIVESQWRFVVGEVNIAHETGKNFEQRKCFSKSFLGTGLSSALLTGPIEAQFQRMAGSMLRTKLPQPVKETDFQRRFQLHFC